MTTPITITITIVSVPLIYLTYRWIRKKFYDETGGADKNKVEGRFQVLFFPDSQVACRDEFTRRYGCTNQRCRFSHDPQTAYAQLLR